MRALLLVKFTSLETRAGYRCIQALPEVDEAHMVYGRYDVVAYLHAETLEEIRHIILSKIQSIPGVIETLPCLLMDDENAEAAPGSVRWVRPGQ